jgi:hypothetical protein
MATKVMFRKWKDDGTVEAVFPELVGTNNPSTCMSYSHIGQHSACDQNYYLGVTVPAKPKEYHDLLAELRLIGYDDLKVVKRMTRKDYETREAELKRLSSPNVDEETV